jgi:hypothetical protein
MLTEAERRSTRRGRFYPVQSINRVRNPDNGTPCSDGKGPSAGRESGVRAVGRQAFRVKRFEFNPFVFQRHNSGFPRPSRTQANRYVMTAECPGGDAPTSSELRMSN